MLDTTILWKIQTKHLQVFSLILTILESSLTLAPHVHVHLSGTSFFSKNITQMWLIIQQVQRVWQHKPVDDNENFPPKTDRTSSNLGTAPVINGTTKCASKLREAFIALTDIDRQRSVTIAAACHKVFRTLMLRRTKLPWYLPMVINPIEKQVWRPPSGLNGRIWVPMAVLFMAEMGKKNRLESTKKCHHTIKVKCS